ncbi:Mll5128 protein, partial [hydrothermal vent metagenome]
NISTIGPSIDYLSEALRWWDHWLKGLDTGVENDPAYRAYVMDSLAPDASLDFRPGRWVAQQNAVDEGINREVLALGDGSLGKAEPFEAVTRTNLACGRGAGEFFPTGAWPGELPGNQAYDDTISTRFESEPMAQARDILGAPKLRLRLVSDAPRAQVIARLCDLRPDGTSMLITMGLLDLRYRGGFEQAHNLVPGEVYEVEIPLDQAAYHLPEGHRLRLSVSNSYWPYCWPEAEDFALTLSGGDLTLPWRAVTQGDEISFDPPVTMEVREYRTLEDGSCGKDWEIDPASGRIVMQVEDDTGRVEDAQSGLITQNTLVERWEIIKGDAASAWVEINETRTLGRGEWQVSSMVMTKMRGKADAFEIEQRLEAFENETKVFDRTWKDKITR